MQVFKPIYFDSFRCIAGQCPDSCCKEWDVQVDEASAALYRSLPGELGEQLRSVLKEEDGETVMTIIDGRCPMWREDGLCRIQAELGHDALCKTCREFPRLTHDYGDFVEKQLELSCPEAARLILSAEAAPFLAEECPGGEAAEYDAEDMRILRKTRSAALALLEDTSRSVPEALALLLIYGYQAQSLLDGCEVPDFDPDSVLAQARQLATPADTAALLDFFSSLEILTEQWKCRLVSPAPGSWSEPLRRLARYGIERYWLQAISDFDLVGRVKLIVTSCILVRTLGGNTVETAQLYSKEIENDADNIDAILDGAYTAPALTDAQLLGHLWGMTLP